MLPHYLQNLSFEHNTNTQDHATHMQHNIHQPNTSYVYAKYCVHFDLHSVIKY